MHVLSCSVRLCILFFFFNDTATTEIYTLSLHDALPISPPRAARSDARSATARCGSRRTRRSGSTRSTARAASPARSEEHTSELQSRQYLVCRLLLEKKKNNRHSICSYIPTTGRLI